MSSRPHHHPHSPAAVPMPWRALLVALVLVGTLAPTTPAAGQAAATPIATDPVRHLARLTDVQPELADASGKARGDLGDSTLDGTGLRRSALPRTTPDGIGPHGTGLHGSAMARTAMARTAVTRTGLARTAVTRPDLRGDAVGACTTATRGVVKRCAAGGCATAVPGGDGGCATTPIAGRGGPVASAKLTVLLPAVGPRSTAPSRHPVPIAADTEPRGPDPDVACGPQETLAPAFASDRS